MKITDTVLDMLMNTKDPISEMLMKIAVMMASCMVTGIVLMIIMKSSK